MWYAGRRKVKEIRLFRNWSLILDIELLECFAIGFDIIFCRNEFHAFLTLGVFEFWIWLRKR